MNEPTPEEAAAALRTVREGKDQAIKSAVGSRWLSIVSGLLVFVYCVAIDLFPAASSWLALAIVAIMLVAAVGLRTRVGSSLLGRPVAVSNRSHPLDAKWRLVRMAPIVGIGVVAALVILLLHVPHGSIYYGAIAGLYIMFLGPRFQLWLLRQQDRA